MEDSSSGCPNSIRQAQAFAQAPRRSACVHVSSNVHQGLACGEEQQSGIVSLAAAVMHSWKKSVAVSISSSNAGASMSQDSGPNASLYLALLECSLWNRAFVNLVLSIPFQLYLASVRLTISSTPPPSIAKVA